MYKPSVSIIALSLYGDFTDSTKVWHDFLVVVNSLTNITVLTTAKHDFPGGGLSGVVVIGESHAAIHTWPEHSYAFAELVTCGDPSSTTAFKNALSSMPSVNTVREEDQKVVGKTQGA